MGYRAPRVAAGFSLVELLAVILIIGLGVQLVSINVGGNKSRQTRQEAKAFANAAMLAAEEAVLSRQQWGVDFFREVDQQGEDRFGYRWLIREEDLWQLAQPQEDQEIEVLFAPGIQLRLEFEEVEQDIVEKLDIPEPLEDEENLTELEKQQAYSEKDKNEVEPHVWMLSSGEMTPFKLFIFEADDPENEIVIDGDELGRVSIENTAIDEEDD
jgi:general secretion pathway protein H